MTSISYDLWFNEAEMALRLGTRSELLKVASKSEKVVFSSERISDLTARIRLDSRRLHYTPIEAVSRLWVILPNRDLRFAAIRAFLFDPESRYSVIRDGDIRLSDLRLIVGAEWEALQYFLRSFVDEEGHPTVASEYKEAIRNLPLPFEEIYELAKRDRWGAIGKILDYRILPSEHPLLKATYRIALLKDHPEIAEKLLANGWVPPAKNGVSFLLEALSKDSEALIRTLVSKSRLDALSEVYRILALAMRFEDHERTIQTIEKLFKAGYRPAEHPDRSLLPVLRSEAEKLKLPTILEVLPVKPTPVTASRTKLPFTF